MRILKALLITKLKGNQVVKLVQTLKVRYFRLKTKSGNIFGGVFTLGCKETLHFVL